MGRVEGYPVPRQQCTVVLCIMSIVSIFTYTNLVSNCNITWHDFYNNLQIKQWISNISSDKWWEIFQSSGEGEWFTDGGEGCLLYTSRCV